MNKRLKIIITLKAQKTDKSSQYEEVLEKNRLIYKEQEDELNALQSKLLTLTENRQEVRQNILIWTEKGNSTSLSIERGKTDYKTNNQRLAILSKEDESFIEESEKLQNDLDLALSSYKNKKEELDKIEKKYHEELKYLDQVQNERWNHQKTIASNKSMYDRTKNLINDKTSNAAIFSKKIFELKKESKQISSTIKSLEQKQLKIDNNYLEEKKELTEIQKKLQTLIDQQQEYIKNNNSLIVKIESLNDQARFYEELIESNEGFPEGTQYVLENPKVFPGVLGTVADMFQVEEEYRDALENGLGELSHCLITKDKKTGLSTLEKALENNAGDLTIIPLKEAIAYKVKLKSLPKSDNVIALASQLVKTDKKLSPLADYILGDLIVVSDLKHAANDKKLEGWRLVDLNGTYSGKNLVIKSRQVSEHGNLIGRRNKLEIISEQLAHSKSEEKKTITSQALIEKKIDSSRIELNKKQELIKNSESQLSQLDSSLMKNHLNQTQILESLGNLKNELAETEKVLNDSQLSLKKIEPGIQKAEKLVSSFQEKINKANQNVLDQGKSRDFQQQILQDARVEMVNIESKNDNIVYKSNSAKEQIKTIEKIQSEIIEEEKKMILLKKEYSQNIENGEKKLTETNAELQKQKSIIDLKQTVFRDTYDSIDKIQTKIKLEQKDRESILENLKLSEFKLNELKQKIEIVREQIKERYDTSIPKKLIVDHVEDELSYQVDKIQRSLDNIGPVNMAVQDEYNEDSERLSHLRRQRDDLVESEENLRETIQKIDRIARKKFQETFKLISKNYKKLFNLFFEGGYGALRLVGDPDPLEADIVIDAQPPGKRNTSLRLLSSGEKALTAISLLFSIYQVKPSPYCILDEVDAPLDDINIHKFTKVLKQFADETQFIVVTHNKLTMEIANHMYGVTQEKKGVSKLVSVSFD